MPFLSWNNKAPGRADEDEDDSGLGGEDGKKQHEVKSNPRLEKCKSCRPPAQEVSGTLRAHDIRVLYVKTNDPRVLFHDPHYNNAGRTSGVSP